MSDLTMTCPATYVLGEGPVWDDRDGTLWWTDIVSKSIHQLQPSTGIVQDFAIGTEVGSLVTRASGGLVLAVREGIATFDPQSAITESISRIQPDQPEMRMNDGKCDRAGRFFVSSMAFEATPGVGRFYRVDGDGTTVSLLDGLTIGNGLAWTSDDRTLYFIDSLAGGVDAFDFDPQLGTISGRRRVVSIPATVGVADGMTIDEEGCLWVAIWGGSAVHRYTPSGDLDRVITLPCAQVTCATFGGPDLADLYITTARNGLTAAERGRQPHAGGLFHIRPGVCGLPAPSFQG